MRVAAPVFAVLAVLTFLVGSVTAATDAADATDAVDITLKPGGGLAFTRADGEASLAFAGRLQARHVYEIHEENPDVNNFAIARMLLGLKGSVHAWRYEVQAEFARREAVTLTDAFVERSILPMLDARAGQFKVAYDRQQLESSGRQTHVERNIVSRTFGKGRDVGVQVRGSALERVLQYNAGVFNGRGAGQANVGSGSLFAGRLSWNPLGDFGLAQGDLVPSASPRVFVDVAGYQSFDGYTDDFGNSADEAGATAGAGLRFAGTYLTGEYFHRERRATVATPAVTSAGWYAQANAMLLPRRLEASVRHAVIDPDTDALGDLQGETTAGFNVFFDGRGHGTKFTADISRMTDETPGIRDYWRVRSQVQLSI